MGNQVSPKTFPKACGREDLPSFGEYNDSSNKWRSFILNNMKTPAGIFFEQVVRKLPDNPKDEPHDYYAQQNLNHGLVKHRSYPLKKGIFEKVETCFKNDPKSDYCRVLMYHIRRQHSSVDKLETKFTDQSRTNLYTDE